MTQLQKDLNDARIGFTDGLNALFRAGLTLAMLACIAGQTLCGFLREKCYRKEIA